MLEQGYWFMPNSVLYSTELSDKQKLLFCAISSLCAEKGYCRAKNEYLWELLWVNKTTISKNISELQEKWFIDVVLEDWHSRKINLVENDKGGCEKSQGGLWKITTPYIYMNNTIEYIYSNYYWKWKWIDEKKCGKIIDNKLKQWITLEEIKQCMVLYNCECRLKQDFQYVKKLENRLTEFQPLSEEQIEETLYTVVKDYSKKKKSDEKFASSKPAKTLWSDLKETFGEERVKNMFKQANSSSIQLTFK